MDTGDEVVDETVHLDGIAGVGAVAAPFDDHELATGPCGERDRAGVGADPVLVALDDENRRGDAGTEVAEGVGIAAEPASRVGEHIGRRLETPADRVLDRLGGMWLAEHLSEEELEEPAVVPSPVVAVELGPPLGRVERLVEQARRPFGLPRCQRNIGADDHDALDPFGTLGRQLDRPQRTSGEGDQHGAFGARRIEHGGDVESELVLGVGVRPDRAAGRA